MPMLRPMPMSIYNNYIVSLQVIYEDYKKYEDRKIFIDIQIEAQKDIGIIDSNYSCNDYDEIF